MSDLPNPNNLEVLQEDPEGQTRDAVIAKLTACKAEIKRMSDAGVNPTDFKVLEQVDAGLDEAIVVVQSVWQFHHKETSAA